MNRLEEYFADPPEPESTAAQRAARRAFYRARRLEDKADRRPWEDD